MIYMINSTKPDKSILLIIVAFLLSVSYSPTGSFTEREGVKGFKETYNPSLQKKNNDASEGFDIDYLGIDQGPTLIQLENSDAGLIMDLMKDNKYIVNGSEKEGFRVEWIAKHPSAKLIELLIL